MQQILENKLKKIESKFKRFLYYQIDFSKPIVGIYGERGVGKTYLMLQKLKETGGFYFSCDNPLVQNLDVFKFVLMLVNDLGYKYIYIDEIYKNSNWINILKYLYDSQLNAKIIVSGSSSLDLYKGTIDLGRRVKFYHMPTLNYLEYLNFFYQTNLIFEQIGIQDILDKHEKLALKYGKYYSDMKFSKFLEQGFYPFSSNISFEDFIEAMQEILKKVIIEDLPIFKVFKTISLINLQKIFYFIANNKPSELSFLSLAKKLQIDKKIVEDVLFLLDKIGIVHLVPKFGSLSDIVRKEYKIFLGNPNLYYIWSYKPDIGTIRESFFLSGIKKFKNVEIFSHQKADFLVKILDKEYIFEIGGKGKNKRQITGEKNAYVIKDDVVIGGKNIIPLWLFGLIS